MGEQLSFSWELFPLGCVIPRSETAGLSTIDLFSVFWGTSIWFSISGCTNSHLTNSAHGYPFLSTSSPTPLSLVLLMAMHSSKCERISHCVVFIYCISWQLVMWWTPSRVPLGHLYISLGRNVSSSKAAPYPVKGSYLCKDQITGFPVVTADTLCNPPFQASYLDSQPPLQEPGEGRSHKRGGSLVTWPAVSVTRVQPGCGYREHSSITNPFCLSTHGKAPYWKWNCARNPLWVPTAARKHSIWRKSQWEIQTVCLTKNTLITKTIVQLFRKKKSVTSF